MTQINTKTDFSREISREKSGMSFRNTMFFLSYYNLIHILKDLVLDSNQLLSIDYVVNYIFKRRKCFMVKLKDNWCHQEGRTFFNLIWHRAYSKGPLSERENLFPPLHGLFLSISSKCSFYTPSHTQEGLINDPSCHQQTLPQSY